MSRGDAYIRVECDFCDTSTGQEPQFEEVQLTALAMKQSWDERNVDARLEKAGWKKVEGGMDMCPECVEAKEEQDEQNSR